MKDSPVSDSDAEQKRFSFDMQPAKHRAAAAVEAVPEAAHTLSGDESVESNNVIDGVDDVSDEIEMTRGTQHNDHGTPPGGVLSAERRRRGFSVADIASQLFLTEAQITALEADDYDQFPAAIFVTGYIRNYARLLDLPADPLVELFNAQNRQSVPKLDRVNRTASTVSKSNMPPLDPRFIGGAVAVIVLILLLWWGMSSDEEATVVIDDTAMVDSDSAIVPPLPAKDPFVTPIEPIAPEVTTPAPKTITPATVGKEAADDVEAESVLETATEIEPEFSAESWVEITDANGRRVMFGLGKPGQTRALSGSAPFNILLGNSPAVTMTYNGEPFDQSRLARGKVARFTLGKGAE